MRKKTKKDLPFKTLSIILITILIFISFYFISSKSAVKITVPKKLSILPSPTITFFPTPAKTISPTINFGFCLNTPVLTYHHIQPSSKAALKKQENLTVSNEMFEMQMSYLNNLNYNTIPAKRLVEALINHSELPPRSIVITFDDGYQDFYTYAYPVIKKYNITANVMIATGFTGGPDYLSWNQIEEMGKSGLVFYTNHTWSHSPLEQSSKEKIKLEIETAKKQLEEHAQATNIFTYPYGSYNSLVEEILKEQGYIGAFSTAPGSYQCDSFIMNLHRTRIGNAPLPSYGF